MSIEHGEMRLAQLRHGGKLHILRTPSGGPWLLAVCSGSCSEGISTARGILSDDLLDDVCRRCIRAERKRLQAVIDGARKALEALGGC